MHCVDVRVPEQSLNEVLRLINKCRQTLHQKSSPSCVRQSPYHYIFVDVIGVKFEIVGDMVADNLVDRSPCVDVVPGIFNFGSFCSLCDLRESTSDDFLTVFLIVSF